MALKKHRCAVTYKMMIYLKRVISETCWPNEKKRRVWEICCLLWNGSLRVHEVLSTSRNEFDPLTTLCSGDIETISDNVAGEQITLIRLHIKSPKERRIGNGVKLEIFENKTMCCPVRAWVKWRKLVNLEEGLPVFREKDLCFTGADFNKIITQLTSPITDNTRGVIRSHSFRSGMASHMGLMGFTDAEIKQQGRWTSKAFEAYIKLDRVKRLKFTKRIGELAV